MPETSAACPCCCAPTSWPVLLRTARRLSQAPCVAEGFGGGQHAEEEGDDDEDPEGVEDSDQEAENDEVTQRDSAAGSPGSPSTVFAVVDSEDEALPAIAAPAARGGSKAMSPIGVSASSQRPAASEQLPKRSGKCMVEADARGKRAKRLVPTAEMVREAAGLHAAARAASSAAGCAAVVGGSEHDAAPEAVGLRARLLKRLGGDASVLGI